ncbi:Eco29kI family restriction endonuclease [uncultured Chloroflexus sp.]|uniref:Eco29kI family restriction endonuclease n=1 Tax=Chloroflexus sp. TaxID=1904827 RepID=UPI00345D5C03
MRNYYTSKNKPYHLYQPLALKDFSDKNAKPVYVGKAMPPGARIGGFGLNTSPGPVLYNRLREHATSISTSRQPQSR